MASNFIIMVSSELKNRIDRLCDEIKATRSMDEGKVCEVYHVDERDEAIQLLLEEMDDLQNDYRQLVDGEEREERLEKEAIWLSLGNPIRQLLRDY